MGGLIDCLVITFYRLKDHDLITIPPIAEETWRMTMMSPERQKVSPFFLGGETILISYPTATMSHEDKRMSMRGNILGDDSVGYELPAVT